MLTPPGGHGESKRPHGKSGKAGPPPVKVASKDTPDTLLDKPLLCAFNTAVQGVVLKNMDTSRKVTLRLLASVLGDLHVNEPASDFFIRLRGMC